MSSLFDIWFMSLYIIHVRPWHLTWMIPITINIILRLSMPYTSQYLIHERWLVANQLTFVLWCFPWLLTWLHWGSTSVFLHSFMPAVWPAAYLFLSHTRIPTFLLHFRFGTVCGSPWNYAGMVTQGGAAPASPRSSQGMGPALVPTYIRIQLPAYGHTYGNYSHIK